MPIINNSTWVYAASFAAFGLCFVLALKSLKGYSATLNGRSVLLSSPYVFPTYKYEQLGMGNFLFESENSGPIALFFLCIVLVLWGFLIAVYMNQGKWVGWLLVSLGQVLLLLMFAQVSLSSISFSLSKLHCAF